MKTKGPIDLSRAAVVNVDIQDAFGKNAASDKLRDLRPTEDAEVKNAAQISESVYEAGGKVVVTKDWHNKLGTELPDGKIDNRAADEFAIYDEHAVGGTSDADLNAPLEATMQKLEAKEGAKRTIIGVDKYDTTSREGSSRLVEVHKNIYDVTKRVDIDGETKANQGFINMLANMQKDGIDTVIITGKIAEVCVRAAASSIRDLFPDMRVVVAEDAVSALPVGAAEGIAEATGNPDFLSKEAVIGVLEKAGVEVVKTSDILPSSQFIADGVLGK